MKAVNLTTCVVLIVAFASGPCIGQNSEAGPKKTYQDPARFDKEIQSFEAADLKSPPPAGGIVCIGSSSMRGWHGTIKEDLAPLTLIPRGFGGSNMNDALFYTDRIVLAYKPRAVVLYEGDNDIAHGIPPEEVAEKFQAFFQKVHKALPDCRIYVLSIKPSISRWTLWPKAQAANSLIKSQCEKDKRLTFVDLAPGMLDEQGSPRKEIFKEDKLHMTRAGYVIWRDILRPILLKGELQFERQ